MNSNLCALTPCIARGRDGKAAWWQGVTGQGAVLSHASPVQGLGVCWGWHWAPWPWEDMGHHWGQGKDKSQAELRLQSTGACLCPAPEPCVPLRGTVPGAALPCPALPAPSQPGVTSGCYRVVLLLSALLGLPSPLQHRDVLSAHILAVNCASKQTC